MRNPTKIRRYLKGKATLVTRSLFPTDRKIISSVSNEENVTSQGKETKVNIRKVTCIAVTGEVERTQVTKFNAFSVSLVPSEVRRRKYPEVWFAHFM
jgi:hypothetical protein